MGCVQVITPEEYHRVAHMHEGSHLPVQQEF